LTVADLAAAKLAHDADRNNGRAMTRFARSTRLGESRYSHTRTVAFAVAITMALWRVSRGRACLLAVSRDDRHLAGAPAFIEATFAPVSAQRGRRRQ
jgi:hypothetical protein